MNISTDWMMKVFDDRQITIIDWMGSSIRGERLKSILNDARSEELALKKSVEYIAYLYMTRCAGIYEQRIDPRYIDTLPEAMLPGRFNKTTDLVKDLENFRWYGDGWYRVRAELTDRWHIVSMLKD